MMPFRKDIKLQAYDTAVIRNVKISTKRKGSYKKNLISVPLKSVLVIEKHSSLLLIKNPRLRS
jgi:hypothetical protein